MQAYNPEVTLSRSNGVLHLRWKGQQNHFPCRVNSERHDACAVGAEPKTFGTTGGFLGRKQLRSDELRLMPNLVQLALTEVME